MATPPNTNSAVSPTITGAKAKQATTSETPVDPFAGVVIGDANSGADDVLTITLAGGGGVLSGAGLSGGAGGVYTLAGTASAITSALDALTFTPNTGAPGSTGTTTFTLSDVSTLTSTGVFKTLATFKNDVNGSGPSGVLTSDPAGDLFGTTASGGPDNSGTVFEIPAATGVLTTLASLDDSYPNRADDTGWSPNGGVVRDAAGDLFGTALSGGPRIAGTVFEIPASTGIVKPLVAFDGANGDGPDDNLIIDAAGDLFGTTSAGGPKDDGTVFEISGATGALTTLATFNGANGSVPYAGLLRDAAGDLFGTTTAGGANDDGIVFEIPASTGVLTTLATFNGANGSVPYAGLLRDAAGDLFGTTQNGGANDDGIVFEILASTGVLTTLATFNRANGAYPDGALVLDPAGDLFGTTYRGGANDNGGIFEIPASTGVLKTLVDFTDLQGDSSQATLLLDANGNLFGTTGAGGAYHEGTVFEFSPGGMSQTTTVDATTSVVNADPAVAPTLSGVTTTVQTTTSEAPIAPFGGVTIGDANAGATETLTIALSGAGGTLSGAGTPSNGVYTLTGTAGDVTTALQAIRFTPVAGQPGATSTSTLTLTDLSSAYATPVSDASTTLADADPAVAPTLSASATLTGQATTSEAPVYPFQSVTIADPNVGAPIDTITVTQTGAGVLSGAGLNAVVGQSGVYNLTGTPTALDADLAGLSFAPVAGSVGTSSTTSFSLSATSSADAGAASKTLSASVVDTDPATGPVTITKTKADQTTTSGAPVTPFAGVTLGDANSGAGDVLTITLGGAGGSLSGAGLSGGAGGVYTLSGTAAAITSALDALSFTPNAAAPGTTNKTTFTLSDVSTVSAGPLTTLATFAGANGSNPYGGLVRDAAGDLFGTTDTGGANDDGIVFEIPASTGVMTTLATFDEANGKFPKSQLIIDAAGDLFGTTPQGGANRFGTVFEIPAATGILTTLASFDGKNNDGAVPVGALVRDASGDLFGMTNRGGATGGGTVFEIPASTGVPTTLVSFTGANGLYPQGGLLLDAAGDLFGTTGGGGPAYDAATYNFGYGTVFEIPASTGTLTTLVNFNGANGGGPQAGLVRDAAGDLFGTTAYSSANDDGIVFEIPASTGAIKTLVSFNGTNGANPAEGGLILDASGNLFGTTLTGGANNDGTVFEISVSTGVLTTLMSFNGADGASPHDALVVDAAGDLFGTTSQGGANNDGTVFEIPAGGKFTTVDTTTSVIDVIPAVAPTISGVTTTVQATTSEAPVTPFAGVTIGDANASATDTLTIAISGAGGTLSGAGTLSNGVYTLTGTASDVTTALRAVSFTPVAGQPGSTNKSTFTLTDLSSANATPVSDDATTVSDVDPAVAPTIAGVNTIVQRTTSEAPVSPFAGVTIGDANTGATDTLTITLSGSGGALADGGGFSALQGGGGVYTLAGTAAAITAELDALVFTPKAGGLGSTNDTAFNLSVASSAFGAATSNGATKVSNVDPGGMGDVHMVTFSGLHYDFQANGTYVLARSTVPDDAFQVQIQTAAIWAAHAVSLTTAVAAQLGGDTITFDAKGSSLISVDGVADTALSAADPVQSFAGGKLVEVNANTYRVDWNSGQSLTVADRGSYLDTGVSLGAANGPGSVQGLLGSDAGQASDFQLADGTVLSQPSAQDILGAFATSWSVDAAHSLFSNDETPAPEIDLSGGEAITLGGVATNTVKFDDASASVLTLLTPQEFVGTIAGLAGNDAIDLAGFSGTTTISSIFGTGAAGTTTDVTLTDGGHAATLKLLNEYTGEFGNSLGAYALASDGGATHGTLLQLAAHG